MAQTVNLDMPLKNALDAPSKYNDFVGCCYVKMAHQYYVL